MASVCSSGHQLQADVLTGPAWRYRFPFMPVERPGALASSRGTARGSVRTRRLDSGFHRCAAIPVLLGLRLANRFASQRGGRACRLAKGFAEAPVKEKAVSTSVSREKVDHVKAMLKDVLEVDVPTILDVFLGVAQFSGFNILGPGEWKKIGGDLLPLVLPIATRGNFDDDLEVLGFLIRTPNGAKLDPEDYQVVVQRPRKSKFVDLVSLDMNRYIKKRAEEAFFRKSKQDEPIIELTKTMYSVRFSGKDRTALDKWLLAEIGAFPDVYKNLALEHITVFNDPKTGLIIADTMRDKFGASWAFAHVFLGNVLKEYFGNVEWTNKEGEKKTRLQEAVHSFRCAFQGGFPLWSMDVGTPDLAQLLYEAQLPTIGSLESLRVFFMKRSADDQRSAVRTGTISLGCAAVAKAQALMDAAVCTGGTYRGVRKQMRDFYEEVPGCEPLVNMIDYFMNE